MAIKNRCLAGRLRHQITVESAVESEDAYGDITSSWSTLYTARASVEPLVGREYYAAQQVNAENNVKFRMRYSATIATTTAKMRVLFDGRYFDIQSVINIEERNKEMLLMTIEDV